MSLDNRLVARRGSESAGKVRQEMGQSRPEIFERSGEGDLHQLQGKAAIQAIPDTFVSAPFVSPLKRIADITIASLALIVGSPFLLLIGVLISLDGGSPLFGHMRIGHGGRRFKCLKFRTMVTDADKKLANVLKENPELRAEWEQCHKLRDDPRITWIGGILRRLSFDELPQFINVLRGEMSIVGPRPIVADEVDKYRKDIAFYLRVRPGITGLWQVSGRNDVSYDERVALDVKYVKEWSLLLDLVIILKTVPALLRRKGAY
jgi:Undecaprenyl-phosphate galactose phosphotransferase WbaP